MLQQQPETSRNRQTLRGVAAAATAIEPDLLRHPLADVELISQRQELADAIFATSSEPHEPDAVFPLLRWGGMFVFATRNRRQATKLAADYARSGFDITHPVRTVSRAFLGIPWLGRQTHFFIARKVQLVLPGQTTERFTYHVYLKPERKAAQSSSPAAGGQSAADEDTAAIRSVEDEAKSINTHGQDSAEAIETGGYEVVKEVPSVELVSQRLRARYPDLGADIIEKRARKFAEKIFPIFLTREAAILKIVQRDLPPEYRSRAPRVLGIEKDSRGYVRRLEMTWLRNGGQALSQLEFARQSADLLRVLHDQVGVMHLDLRLDNFVITEHGVGFVDFGSAVRQNENLKENPLLGGLFDELMRTSEIQRMLLNMTRSGQVTNQAISCGLHRVDKAVDFFYLAVQISAPHANPDLKGLVRYDPNSDEAKALARLTALILQPRDPAHPQFGSAADILRGIERVEKTLGGTRAVG
jgi:hypothetical protein